MQIFASLLSVSVCKKTARGPGRRKGGSYSIAFRVSPA
jgi:hypothetical protein